MCASGGNCVWAENRFHDYVMVNIFALVYAFNYALINFQRFAVVFTVLSLFYFCNFVKNIESRLEWNAQLITAGANNFYSSTETLLYLSQRKINIDDFVRWLLLHLRHFQHQSQIAQKSVKVSLNFPLYSMILRDRVICQSKGLCAWLLSKPLRWKTHQTIIIN